jgi:predicted acyl esterase
MTPHTFAQAQEAAIAAALRPTREFTLEPSEMFVVMRDGVRLATDVYLPEGEGPWPVILTRTPYGKRIPWAAEPFAFYLDAGFALVIQDCRGRFASGGEYRMFLDDAEDGYETVEWASAQTWSTGRIGMTGRSAAGITTFLAAMAGAPSLVAGWVSITRNPNSTDSRWPGGIYAENLGDEWNKAAGIHDPDHARPRFCRVTEEDRGIDLWRHLGNVRIPIAHVGGWFDINTQQTLDAFTRLQTEGGPGARGNQRLVMGAFGHIQSGESLGFPNRPGEAGMGQHLAVRWFNHWLRRQDTGLLSEPPVRYFLMGGIGAADGPGNVWRTAESWPPPATRRSLFLQVSGELTDAAATDAGSRTFVYDPQRPTPALGGGNLYLLSGPLDQRPVAVREDGIRYVGPVLEAPVEIVGEMSARLWVSTDAADTDVIVKVLDIAPDGEEILIQDQGLRLRHRNGVEETEPLEPGRVYPIEFSLWSTAKVVDVGHRLGVTIQGSSVPRFEAHTNTWEPVATYAQSVCARTTVHSGAETPSQIVLPILSSS